MKRDRAVNIGLIVVALGGLVVGAILADIVRVLIAVVIAYAVLRLGLAMLRNLARPLPEPPDPGTLRKVKLEYRCNVCGAEVRMTDEMDLVTPRRGSRAAPATLPGRDGPGDHPHRVSGPVPSPAIPAGSYPSRPRELSTPVHKVGGNYNCVITRPQPGHPRGQAVSGTAWR